MNQPVQALCALCRVPLEGPAEPKLDDRFARPSCGNGDTYEAVVREVGEYAVEKLIKDGERRFAKTARRSQSLNVTVSPSASGRARRFIGGDGV